MTNQEIKECFAYQCESCKYSRPNGKCVEDGECQKVQKACIKGLEELEMYKSLGAIEELKALIKKAAPNEPDLQQVEVDCYEHDCYNCPECGSFLGYIIERKEENYQVSYCENCGQKLDWDVFDIEEE